MVITHFKGVHFSFPPQIGFWYKPVNLQWHCKFSDGAKYTQTDPVEQLDWLKLCGVTFTLNAQQESCMIGWRYLPDADVFQFNAYWHVDGGRDYTEALLELPGAGELDAKIFIDYDEKKYTVALCSKAKRVYRSKRFNHDRGFVRTVNSWFGGTLPAPKKVTFTKEFYN